MKKLLFSVMALAMGAFALVSCNKDDDKNDEKNGGQEKFLPYEQQQRIIEQSVEGLAQTIDFNDLAASLTTVINSVANLAGNEVDWNFGLEIAAGQDPVLGRKIAAIKELLKSDDINIVLDNLYFEADIEFAPKPSTGGGYLDTVYSQRRGGGVPGDSIAVTLIPVVKNVIHNTDRFKLNFKTVDNHVISVILKGSNDKDARLSWVDTRKETTKNVNLPNVIQLSMAVDGKNIVSFDGSLDTDFNVVAKGYYDRNAENDTTFKVSEVTAYGQNLSLTANLAIDKYAVSANAVYSARSGLNVDAKALLYGNEALTVNVNLDVTLDEHINWAEPLSLMNWAMDYEKVRGLNATAVLGGDQIKVVAALKENPVKYQEIMTGIAPFIAGITPEPDAVKAMVDKFNEIFVGEVYFKGYDKPQAKLKLIYEEPSAGTKANILSSVMDALNASGLRILVETYDAKGNVVMITFNEYFGMINLQGALATLRSNFQQAFAPLLGLLASDDGKQFVSRPRDFEVL